MNLSELTGIELETLENLTPSQRWQVAKHYLAAAEARVKQLKELESELERATIDQFDALDQTSVKNKAFSITPNFCFQCGLDEYRQDDIEIPAATVFQSLRTQTTIKDTPEAFEALRAAGLERYIVQKINPSQLSAWYRSELEANSDFQLSDILRPHVTIYQSYELRSRKS